MNKLICWIKGIHYVKKDDNCYYCIFCKKAKADGDGFIGVKCIK